MEGIARKATFIFFAKALVTLFTFFSFMYLGKDPDMIGPVATLAIALSFVGMFSFVSDLGYGYAHVKRISEGQDEAACNATYATIRGGLTAIMVACVLVAVFAWDNLKPGGAFSNAEQEWAVYIILAYYALFSISQIPALTFSGRMESAKQQIPEVLGTIARAPLIILTVMMGLGALALSMSYLVTGLIMCLVSLYLFKNYPIGNYDSSFAKSYTKYAGPVMLLLFIVVLSQNLPAVLIAFFTGSDTEVAGFFMVQRVALIFILISTSISLILFPKISQTHACGDTNGLRDTCRKAERMISITMVPVVAFTVALSPALIQIFLSNTYLHAANALALLSLFALVTSLDMTYLNVLYGVDRPDLNLRLGMITVAVTIGGFLVLIPTSFFGIGLLGGGATGAAAALLIGAVAEFIVSRYYAIKIAGVRSYGRIWIHFTAGIVMAALLLGADSTGLIEGWYTLAAAGAAALAVYLGILWAAKELSKTDIRFFVDLLSLRKMKDYLSSELRGKK